MKGQQYPSLARKLPSAYEGYIELGERIYNPGDTITGKVHLELHKKLCCDVLTVRLYGSARVFFTETVNSTKPGVLSENRASEQEIVLVDKELALWTAPLTGKKAIEPTIDDIVRMARSTSIRPALPKPTNLEGVESGSHDYNFTFSLPKVDQYTSFDTKGAAGCVRYYILLQAIRNGMVMFKKKLLFPVVVPVHMDYIPRALEPAEVTKYCNFAKGTLTATLSLKKIGFLPGEPIEGTICIKNNGKESIKTAFLRIVQTTDAISKRPEVRIKSTTFETSGVGLPVHKILAGHDYSYPIEFYIPALVPNFEIPACLRVSYELVLTIGRDRNTMSNGILTLSAPIFIATHYTAINGSSSKSSEAYSSHASYGSYANIPPPTYFGNEFNNHLPPLPTYSEAVGGRSAINDDDDENDYSPLLYQYNFDIKKRNN